LLVLFLFSFRIIEGAIYTDVLHRKAMSGNVTRVTRCHQRNSTVQNEKIDIFLKRRPMRISIKSGVVRLPRLILLLPLFLSSLAYAAEFRMSLLLSNNSASYQSFSNTLKKNLPASVQTSVVDALTVNHIVADLIVAVGIKATETAMLQSTTPVLAVMIPQSGYDALLSNLPAQKGPPNISAIYLNQPWDRQMNFLFAVLPEYRRVGVLYSATLQKDIPRLREEVIAHGGSLMAQAVYSDATLFSELEKVLRASDVLLAVPDSAIYSSSNVRNILLSTYKLNVPLIGLSQGYVNAGAVAALFSTPEQLAEQSAITVLAYAQTARWPLPQYPDAFTIAVNSQVAHSLGIELNSDEEIRARMKKNRRNANE
jgi:putative ABC transport system substrate-binding protein